MTDKTKGRQIKFMGSADVREIARGETRSGTLPALPAVLRWNRQNDWIVETGLHPDVDAAWWDFLTESGEFVDVTDQKVKPLNVHQKTFLAMGGRSNYNKALDEAFVAKSEQKADTSGTPDAPRPTPETKGDKK